MTENIEKKEMTLLPVDINEIRTGRGGGRGKGTKYGKYANAIAPYIDQLKELIEESKDGLVRLKSDDVKKQMGGEFTTKHPTSIYWGLKYSLFQKGIWVTAGKHISGSDLLVIRETTPEDKLPDSLTKIREDLSNFQDIEEPKEIVDQDQK